MGPIRIALTSVTDRIAADELARAAAAIQVQALRDFAPAWGAPAIVTAAPFEAIPAGHLPVIVHDTPDDGASNGFHRTRGDDWPYVMVPCGPTWTLAASHEILRALANPTGSARAPGLSCMAGQAEVDYLLDVCAPCQDIAHAYAIDGVAVSDFCLPAFYAPGPGAREGVAALSFTGALTAPFRPAGGGLVTWFADDRLVYQARADQRGHALVHGGFSPAGRGRLLLREFADQLTPDRMTRLATAPRPVRLQEAEQNARRVRLTNMDRFRDDMAWRFGHAVRVPDAPRDTAPAREAEIAVLVPRRRAFGQAQGGGGAEACASERTSP